MPSFASPEHIPSLEAVERYLGTREQEHLCKDITTCNPWPTEALLMHDLALAYAHPETPDRIRELRELTRTVSWFTYKPLTAEELPLYFERLIPVMTHDIPHISPHDVERIREALLEPNVTGDSLEPATQTIDKLFLSAWDALNTVRQRADMSWKLMNKPSLVAALEEKKALVRGLRPIRDALLFRRHFSGWLQR